MSKALKYSALIILAIFSIAALIMYIVLASNNITILNIGSPEKFASIKKVSMTGHEDKNRSWDIKAEECWVGRDKDRSIFENVSKCVIYEDHYPIVRFLTARRIIVNSRTRDIEVFKIVDGKGWLTASIDLNRTSRKKEYSTLYADYIKYNPNSNKASIRDNILIIKKDLTIEAKEAELDLDKDISQLSGGCKYMKGNNIVIGKSSTAYLKNDLIDITSIEVAQQNKTAFAAAGTLDDRARTLLLKGNVLAVIEKAANALKEASVEKIRESETKKALQERTVITCDRMDLSFDNKDFSAGGNVLVVQKGKKAKSDAAHYDENSENILMTGNVYMERENGWIKTDRIIVSVKDETFHASGNVETEFIIKK